MKRKGTISIIIFMIALSLFGSYHIYYYFLDKANDDLVRDYYISNYIDEKPIVKKIDNEEKEEYLGILEIPKISLVTGFYHINSKNNNVNKSVTILKESIMPNENGGVIYLVAHSGTGYLAFFKNINKLDINDTISLDINNHHYQYIINDKYEVDKNGKIEVNHNIHDNYLVLSTCNGNKQLVIISKLINNNV